MAVRRLIPALPRLGFGRARSGVPEINLIPDQYRRRLRLSLRTSLFLALAVELLIAVAAFQQETTRPGIQALTSRVLGSQSSTEERIQRVQTQLNEVKKELETLRQGRDEIKKRSMNWSALLAHLQGSLTEGVELDRVNQTGVTIVIYGMAQNLTQVEGFRAKLVSKSEVIRGASLVSIQQDPKTNRLNFTMSVRLP
ncbi:MAG: hypothetical protein HYY31_06670 [Chloroflexi bacterium]|nr:hypothetical protein [Chloroflexota bacterium]